MNDEVKKELKDLSIEELYNFLVKTEELEGLAKEKKTEVNIKDLKPNKVKRGSKN